MSFFLGDSGVLGPAAGSGMGRTRRYYYCALYILMVVSLICGQSSIFFFFIRKRPHVVSFVYVHNNRTWFRIYLYSFSFVVIISLLPMDI